MSDSETLFVQLAVQRGLTTQRVAQECMAALPNAGGRTLPQLLVERAQIPQDVARSLFHEAQAMAQRDHAPDLSGFISDTGHGGGPTPTQGPSTGPYPAQGPQGTRNDRAVPSGHTPQGYTPGSSPPSSSSSWDSQPSAQHDGPISPGALQPGQTFNRYRLESELGRGGMGVVWKARQVDLDRHVAVKMLLQGALAAPKHRQRFTAEAKAVARLLHPNLVTVHDVGDEGGILFFTMDFVDGPSLARYLKTTPVTLVQALTIGVGIAEGLEHAHQQGIVHRDLKPANVLIDGRGAPRITDFGIAKDTRNIGMTAEGEVLGTPSYMSPEQADGSARDVDGRTDVYSLGAILYRMISGAAPFVGDSSYDVIQKVRNSAPVPLRKQAKDVPADVERIVMKCLARKREDRYAKASDVARELRRACDALSDDGSAAPPAPQSKVLWVGAAIGLVVVVLVAAILGIQFRRNVELRARLDREAAEHAAQQEAEELKRAQAKARESLEQAHELERTDPKAALAAARDATQVLGSDPEALTLLATLLLSVDSDASGSLAAADRALGADPKHVGALKARGQALLALGRGDRDVEDVARELEKGGAPEGLAAAAELRCDAALARDELSVAVVHLDQAVRGLPEDSRLRMRMVELLLRARRFASAEEEAKEAIRLLPRSADPYALRAKARAELNRKADAYTDVQQALALEPNHALALELEKQVKVEPSARPPSGHGAPGGTSDHDKTHALLSEANDLLRKRKLDDAKLRVDAAYRNEPKLTCEKALILRVNLSVVLRLYRIAVSDSATVLERSPNDPRTLEQVARIRLLAGRVGEAHDLVTKSLELQPATSTAQLLLAEVYEKQGQEPKALEAYSEAIRMDGSKPDPYHRRAHLLVKLERFQEAVTDIDAALERAPGTGHFLSMKGKALFALGEKPQARAAFEAVVAAKVAKPGEKEHARDMIRQLDAQ